MRKKSKLLNILPFVALVAVLGAAFITYQVGVVNGTQPLALDLAVQQFFIDLRSDWISPFVIGVTHMSDTVTIVAFCVILVLLPNRKKYGLPVTIGALAGLAVYKPMKHLFLRARPDEIYHLIEQGGYSFPSGHSTTSVIFYGLMFYLITKHCENPVARKVLQAVCLLLAVTIGPTRLYVGVHWATDVMAGWCIGIAVVLMGIYILERIYRKNENI